MEKKAPQSKVLICQSAGFLAIIALSWLDEWLGLPSLIFKGHPYISDFRVSTMEMLLVLAVWFLVSRSTRRLMSHVHYLEGFMRICAWCRRIHYKGHWIRLEEFMEKGFDTPTSHGICPDCLHEETNALNEAKRRAASQTVEPLSPPCEHKAHDA